MSLPNLRAKAAAQGETVRAIKKGEANGDLKEALSILTDLKKAVATAELEEVERRPSYTKCRLQLENLLKRRSFFFPGFEIYGGCGGLFDWGPPGCALLNEVVLAWRNHFVLQEDMLEVSCTCLTPHNVFKTSGHVDRFTDLLTSDSITGESYRSDKILEDFIENLLLSKDHVANREELELIRRKADSYDAAEMFQIFKSLGVLSPLGNPLTLPVPFNLMFPTQIGPKDGSTLGYLRPETAQGIFVNFKRLLEYNTGKIPFAAAQIGLGFRNEIAPRNGLLRVREFLMGEIEHFVDPTNKSHKKFNNVASLKLPLFSRVNQLEDGVVVRDVTLNEAVAKGVIANEALAYFMARTHLFLISCGIQELGIRYRQHLSTEMAHYATDCWDAEIETSFGWVECVGHADRAAYDLTSHSNATKIPLVATRKLATPLTKPVVNAIFNKGKLGATFKEKQANIVKHLSEVFTDEQKNSLELLLASTGQGTVEIEGESYVIDRSLVRFEKATLTLHEETYTPSVIEPSFGLGRIIYAVLEHTFRSRGIAEQEDRCFLALPSLISPIKCSILPLSHSEEFLPYVELVKSKLVLLGVSYKIDDSSASIGKRYARTDEIGIPFGITIDFQTLVDQSVTIRERDSMKQIRVESIDQASQHVSNLISGVTQKEKLF